MSVDKKTHSRSLRQRLIRLGIAPGTAEHSRIRSRVQKHGWSLKRALEQPSRNSPVGSLTARMDKINCKLPYGAVWARLNSGYTFEEAVSKPIRVFLNDPEKRKERGRQLIRKARGQLNSPTRPKPVTCEWPGCSRAAFVEDHDHSTGQWRFYLCGPHNSGLGLIGDTKAALQAGIELFDLYCNDPQFNKDI